MKINQITLAGWMMFLLLFFGVFLSAQSSCGGPLNAKDEKKVREVNHYVHTHGMPCRGKILMVVSSPAVSGQTGWPIGFWAAELTHPLLVFQEAGYEVDIASTEGGKNVMDGYSDPRHESGYSAHDVITLGIPSAGLVQ